jgi:hypothetical protein
MTPWRVGLAVAAAFAAALALANLVLWHASVWLPIGFYSVLVLALAVFEAGRYRPRVDRSARTWQATGERFIDPTTGADTTVYYDPASGRRDYRSS